jgi:hypothetical protein
MSVCGKMPTLQTGKEVEFEDHLQHRWGSVASSVIVTLPRGGVRLILANLPGVSYKSAPRRFRETRSTSKECSHRINVPRSSIPDINLLAAVAKSWYVENE